MKLTLKALKSTYMTHIYIYTYYVFGFGVSNNIWKKYQRRNRYWMRRKASLSWKDANMSPYRDTVTRDGGPKWHGRALFVLGCLLTRTPITYVYVYRLHACAPNTDCLSYRLATILRSSSTAVMARLSFSRTSLLSLLPSTLSPSAVVSIPRDRVARCTS